MMVSIENLVHNDCFDYFSCIHFFSTIYSEYPIHYFYSSYLISYSQVVDPSSYSQTLLFGNWYFCVFLFNSGSFTFIYSEFIINTYDFQVVGNFYCTVYFFTISSMCLLSSFL